MARTRTTDGIAIIRLRERLGILQKDLAGRIGVSQSYMSRIETGVENPGPTSKTVRRIALELGVDLDAITKPVEPEAAA